MWMEALVWFGFFSVIEWALGIAYVKSLLWIGDRLKGVSKSVATYLIYFAVASLLGAPLILFIRRVGKLEDISFTIWVLICFLVSVIPMVIVLYRNIDRLREKGFFPKN
jgi:hypothetical protein